MRVSTDHPSWKEAFIHPKDAHGVLIQIAQSAWTDEQSAEHHLSDHETDDQEHRDSMFEAHCITFTPAATPGGIQPPPSAWNRLNTACNRASRASE